MGAKEKACTAEGRGAAFGVGVGNYTQAFIEVELPCLVSPPGSSPLLEVAVVRGVVVELGRQGHGLDDRPIGAAVLRSRAVVAVSDAARVTSAASATEALAASLARVEVDFLLGRRHLHGQEVLTSVKLAE